VIAIASRHEQITENHVGPVLDGELDSSLAIRRLDHIPADLAQHRTRGGAAEVIIIYQQNRLHRGISDPFRFAENDKPAE
jgi:hypothetical protein